MRLSSFISKGVTMLNRSHQPKGRNEPFKRGALGVSSQSAFRVQPKKHIATIGLCAIVLMSLLSGCHDDDSNQLSGHWVVDLKPMMGHLRSDAHAQWAAEAASELMTTLMTRMQFIFEPGILTMGYPAKTRQLAFELVRTEKSGRMVFRIVDSPYLMRIRLHEQTMSLDFEGKTWFLKRRSENIK